MSTVIYVLFALWVLGVLISLILFLENLRTARRGI